MRRQSKGRLRTQGARLAASLCEHPRFSAFEMGDIEGRVDFPVAFVAEVEGYGPQSFLSAKSEGGRLWLEHRGLEVDADMLSEADMERLEAMLEKE